MKNLKKALVLVLAFAMVFSLFTFNASAASFADDEDIVNKEAVKAMAELGIINGYEDGTFLPKQAVTRAEMCKMICVALNGGKAPILDSTAVVFSDTKGHWANAYISYCASKGIVSGDAGKGGAFRPDAAVTGLEAAKMMLVALGYNPAIAGFTGADWAQNVAMAANDRGLFNKLGDLNVVAGLSRDSASQLIYNGLNAGMVKYENVLTVGPDGQLTSTPNMVEETYAGTTTVKTILGEKFKIKYDYGQVTTVGKKTFSIVTNNALGVSYSDNNNGATVTYTEVTSDYSALIGQNVKVMIKASGEVLGVVAFEKNKVVVANISAVEAGSSATAFKIDGKTYNTKDASGQIDLITITANGTVSAASTVNIAGLCGQTSSYDTIKFIDIDGDGKYEFAVRTVVTPAKVTYVSSTEIIAGNTYKSTSSNIPAGLAKNDYVAVTYNLHQGKYDIVKLAKNTGVLAINSAGNKYLLNGTWYYRGGVSLTSTSAGKTVEYYVCNGVVVAAKVSTSNVTASNYVMVLKKADTISGNQVKVLYSDGTKAVLNVSVDSTVAFNLINAGELYKLSELSNGYSFAVAATFGDYTWVPGAANDIALTTGQVNGAIGSTYVDDAAVVYLFNPDTDDGKVITGKQLKSLNGSTTELDADVNKLFTTSNGYFTTKVNGLTRATIVAVRMVDTPNVNTGVLPTVGDTAKKYALIVDSAYQADNDYIVYKIWNGTSMETVKEKNTGVLASRTRSEVIKYSSIVDGVIKDVVAMTLTNGIGAAASTADTLYATAVVGLTSTKLYTTQTNGYDLDSDTVYMYYDSSATTAADMGKPGGELTLADKAAESTVLIPNVKFVRDSENDVVFVLVDVKNKLADASTKTLVGITATDGSVTNGTVTFSKTTNILLGEILEVEIAATTGNVTGTITLSNGVFADTGSATRTVSIANGTSQTFTIVATTVSTAISAALS